MATISRPMEIMKKIVLALCACLPFAAYADDDSPVTPYRPSVSSPAQLPAPGQLELEIGGLRTQNSGQKRDSLPYQLKLGFNPEWGILLGGEAYVSAQNAGGHRDGGTERQHPQNAARQGSLILHGRQSFGDGRRATLRYQSSMARSGRSTPDDRLYQVPEHLV